MVSRRAEEGSGVFVCVVGRAESMQNTSSAAAQNRLAVTLYTKGRHGGNRSEGQGSARPGRGQALERKQDKLWPYGHNMPLDNSRDNMYYTPAIEGGSL